MQNNGEIAVESQQLTDLYALQNILTLIQKILLLVSQGQTGKVITVNGANLFQLASYYYQDATLWTAIANANKLTDPVIEAGQTMNLIIPNKTTNSGGILQL